MIDDGYISYEPKLGVFNIKGTNAIHVVKLFPSTSSSCPAVGICYHILAAKAGCDINETVERKISLSQLKKNARRPSKKSGRKRPRLGDYDVEPAPDACDPYGIFR